MKASKLLGKTVVLKFPGKGEEKLLYKVTNVNEVTGRVMIQCQNSCLTLPPIELVSIDEVLILDNVHFVQPKL